MASMLARCPWWVLTRPLCRRVTMLPYTGSDQALITGQMRRRRPDLRRGTRSAVAATHAASIAGVHRFARCHGPI